MTRWIDRLQEPEVIGCQLDDASRLVAHRAVLRRKSMIREVFDEFHAAFDALDTKLLRGRGARIELGAGVYPVRETIPHVVATDVIPAAHLDRALDGEAMDLPKDSVRAFYLQNVFHHFPHPSRFLAEIERTLVPGGGAILIEPHSGPLAAWLYPRLFSSEGYDPHAESWESPMEGPMRGANQALSHLVFDRDLFRFEREHPLLEIVHREVLTNWVRYLFSGGLNFKPLVPATTTPMLRFVERMLAPLRKFFGLHRVVVLRKRDPVPNG